MTVFFFLLFLLLFYKRTTVDCSRAYSGMDIHPGYGAEHVVFAVRVV